MLSSIPRDDASDRAVRGSTSASRSTLLERQLHCQLRLARVADTRAQEAVEVEQRRRAQRVDVVRVVERVEHLDDRRQLVVRAKAERAPESPVEREILVVLPLAVPAAIDTVEDPRARGDRLGAAVLHP